MKKQNIKRKIHHKIWISYWIQQLLDKICHAVVGEHSFHRMMRTIKRRRRSLIFGCTMQDVAHDAMRVLPCG